MFVDPNTWQTVKESSRARFSGLKPLREFFDKNRFGKPASIVGMVRRLCPNSSTPRLTLALLVFTSRLNYNLVYFQNNYMLIVLLVTAYLLFTNLWLLLTILFVLGMLRDYRPIYFLCNVYVTPMFLGGFKFVSSIPANQPTKLFGNGKYMCIELYDTCISNVPMPKFKSLPDNCGPFSLRQASSSFGFREQLGQSSGWRLCAPLSLQPMRE